MKTQKYISYISNIPTHKFCVMFSYRLPCDFVLTNETY